MPENVFIHQLNLGELESEVLRLMWRTFSEDDNGWPLSTDFKGSLTRTRVRKKLNQALSEIATLTKILKGWFVLPTKANYKQYPCPANVFDIISPVYYFTSATNYNEIDVYDELELDDLNPGWRTETGTEPSYAYSGYWNQTQRYLGITPTPTVDATAITVGGSEKSQPYGAVGAVEGAAAVGSSATKMVDSQGQDFSTLGVVNGMVILNTTDGSRGTITSISTTNSTNDSINCSGGLSGGSANTFTAGDEFRIIGGSYGGIIEIGDSEATYLISRYGGIYSTTVTMAAGNLLVRSYNRPALLVALNQYPELPPELHYAVAERAAGLLCASFPADTEEFKQGQVYTQNSLQAIALGSAMAASHFKGDDKFLQSKR